jgi:glycine cleavage system transcriptional repressor
MPHNALILLATGRDRPGIVDRISGLVYNAGCNLEDSRMALLGGEFALIVLFTGSTKELQEVREGVSPMAEELDLTVQLKETVAGPEARQGRTPAVHYRLHAVAMDHPGIVHKLTRVLSEYQVNVARLDTTLSNAPVSGAPIFSIEMETEVPTDVAVTALRRHLARFAEAENIDLEFRVAK